MSNSSRSGFLFKTKLLAASVVVLCRLTCLNAAASLPNVPSKGVLNNLEANRKIDPLNTLFLTPNQLTDAPKYYERNALLYKTPASSPKDLRPLDGARINPKDMSLVGVDEEDDSSIDSFIKAMRRRNSAASESGVTYNGPKKSTDIIGADGEASIQRKSTNIDEDSSGPSTGTSPSASQLRHKASAPRRRRRASVRHTPPKLKSRRVSRNSKRRKLRHGIKPKRRA